MLLYSRDGTEDGVEWSDLSWTDIQEAMVEERRLEATKKIINSDWGQDAGLGDDDTPDWLQTPSLEQYEARYNRPGHHPEDTLKLALLKYARRWDFHERDPDGLRPVIRPTEHDMVREVLDHRDRYPHGMYTFDNPDRIEAVRDRIITRRSAQMGLEWGDTALSDDLK